MKGVVTLDILPTSLFQNQSCEVLGVAEAAPVQQRVLRLVVFRVAAKGQRDTLPRREETIAVV